MKITLIIVAVVLAIPILATLVFFFGAKISNSAYKEVNPNLSDSYFSKEGKIYYSTGGNLTFVGAYELHGSDAETFKVLGETVAVDKNNIYFGKTLLAAERIDFEEVGDDQLETMQAHPDLLAADTSDLKLYFYTHFKTDEKMQSSFIGDRTKVYAYSQLVEGAKPEEFNAISFNYGHDRKNVYHDVSVLESYDEQSIRVEHMDWEKDVLYLGDKVYIGSTFRDDIDAATYKTVDKKHSVDKNNAYFERQPIKDSEPSSYQTFKRSEFYSKDSRNVYYSGKKLHSADPNTFKLHGEYAEVVSDKDHFYFTDTKVLNLKPGVDFKFSPTSMDSYKYQKLYVTNNTALIVDKEDLRVVGEDSSIVVYDNKVYDKFRGYLRGAIPTDIKFIDKNKLYTISSGKVFFEATEMIDASPETCKVYPFDSGLSGYAETPQYIYFQGESISINGKRYRREESDGFLRSFEGNNFVCNNRFCFIDEQRVKSINPADVPKLSYDDMNNYSVEES
ncbi:MAG: DKNYY domain-containing protein [Kangiellaceae bacterium]|nr:DKNYY domain-containing protein [Kangiellaceae bacterium]